MIIEPPKQDLLGGQAQELLQSLVLFQKPVKFGMELDINLAQQAAANDLPDQTQNEMLANLNDISTSDIHDGAANTLCGVDDDIVVLCHVESIQFLDFLSSLVQNTLINGIRHAVIDQLCQNKTILALVEHFESIGREGQKLADVRVAGQNCIDVSGELGSLIFIDRMCDICR